MGETVRAGIGSIDMGQREGAWAMGMSPFKTMLYVVLPQAFKNICLLYTSYRIWPYVTWNGYMYVKRRN